jgi:hypothetical protein
MRAGRTEPEWQACCGAIEYPTFEDARLAGRGENHRLAAVGREGFAALPTRVVKVTTRWETFE